MKSFKPLIFLSLLIFPFIDVSAQLSGIVNEYRKVNFTDSAKGIVRLVNASNMTQYIGRSVMLIQMKGAVIDSSQSSAFGSIINIKEAGNFEMGVICGQQSDSIILERKLQNYYDPSGFVQLVVFPAKSANITIADTVRAKSWDPISGTGGILAIEATDTVFLNSVLYADSAGFRGGSLVNYSGNCSNFDFPQFAYTCNEFFLPASTGNIYKHGGKKGEGIAAYIVNKDYARGRQANGGGGGNNSNHGGGGGGNYGGGGIAGSNIGTLCVNPNPGLESAPLSGKGYSTFNFKIFAGGGGGAGHENNNFGTPGGQGGGIIYIKCKVLVSNNQKISANGGRPYQPSLVLHPFAAGGDGGGGGGGGGVVIMNTKDIIGNLNIESKGGNGSNTGADGGACAGPGGGGGGGVVWLANAAVPVNLNISTGGGNNGVALNVAPNSCSNSNNGAASGAVGAIITSFALPALRDSSPVCLSILPQSFILSFRGFDDGGRRKFIAELSDASLALKVVLQRSYDGLVYSVLTTQMNNYTLTYTFSEEIEKRRVYYRLMVISSAGDVRYSSVLLFRYDANTQPVLNIFPNPVLNRLNFTISGVEREIVNARVIDANGRIITSVRIILNPLFPSYALPATGLSKGSYQLEITGRNFKVNKRFTHL